MTRAARARPSKRRVSARRRPTTPAEALPAIEGAVLGLDVSSKTVGWSYWEAGRLVDYGKWHPEGAEHYHGERLLGYGEWLADALERLKPDHLVIEVPWQGRNRDAFRVLTMYQGVALAGWFDYRGAELPARNQLQPSVVKRILRADKGATYEQRKALMVALINRVHDLDLRYKRADGGRVSDDDIADAIALVHAWLERRSDAPAADPPPRPRRKEPR